MFNPTGDGSHHNQAEGTFRFALKASPIRLEDRERIAEQMLRLTRWPLMLAVGLGQLVIWVTAKGAEPTRFIPGLIMLAALCVLDPLVKRKGALAAFKVIIVGSAATTSFAVLFHGVFAPAFVANILILAAVVPLYGTRGGVLLALWAALGGAAWFALRHFGYGPPFHYPNAGMVYLLVCGYMLFAVGLLSIPNYLLAAALRLSEQRRQELVRAERDLANARRLESLGQLAGGVAHDFNNMLTALQGALESLTDERAADTERREAIDTMGQAIQRATEVTRKLLAFGRRDRFETRTIDLNQLVTDESRLLRRTLGAPIELVLSLDARGVIIEGDEAAIEHAILNLVVNARDAMLSGGKLTIRTRCTTFDQSICSQLPFSAKPGPYAVLSVEDTGVGMDERVKAHAFEPFFTTKSIGEGTGLGLAAVHGTMLSHFGGVIVESRTNQGTTVHLHFPAVQGRQVTAKPPSLTHKVTRLSGAVLIVDDEPLMLRVGKRHLAQLGLDAVAVGDGQAALDLLAAGADFDCIVTDFVMPKMSGLSLIERIRELQIDVPVVIMTGYPSGSTPGQHTAISEYPCLRKPFNREDLAKVLAPLLEKRQTSESVKAQDRLGVAPFG